MSKPIPEIQITSADKSEARKTEEWQEEEGSSGEESTDGEVWELLSNLASPGRIRRTVYSVPTGSDTHSDLSVSEEEQVGGMNFSQMQLSSATNESTNIKERLKPKKLYTPSRTDRLNTNKSASLFSSFHSYEKHTDNEFLYSDKETGTRAKINRKGKSMDGFISDMEDSDSSLSENPFRYPRKNSLQIEKDCWFPNRQERKKSEPILCGMALYDNTDSNNQKPKQTKVKNSLVLKKKRESTTSKSVNHNTKLSGSQAKSLSQQNTLFPLFLDDKGSCTDIEELDYDDTETATNNRSVAYIPESKREIVIANQNMKGDVALILPINKPSNMKLAIKMEGFDCGFSDVEDLPDYFEEELRPCPTPEPPLTEASYVKSSESMKGKSKLQILIDRHDPLTDTEEINVKKEGKYKKSKVRDMCALSVGKIINEPLTDTEEIVINSGSRPKTLNYLKIEKSKSEPLTDSEDIILDEGFKLRQRTKHDKRLVRAEESGDSSELDEPEVPDGAGALPLGSNIDQCPTDVEEFSDENLPGERIPPRKFLEFRVISASNFTTSKESHRPFSEEAKAKLRSSRQDIVLRSELGSPCGPTEQEDFSGEEEVVTNPPFEPPLEPHISTVHIQNSRTFHPDNNELKVSIPPDPLTDVEEIDVNPDRRF